MDRTFICVIRRSITICLEKQNLNVFINLRGGGSSVITLCSISIKEVLDLGVLNVLDISVVSVLQLWSRLGDTGLLQSCQGNIGLGFSKAVEDHLHNETED